MPTEALVRGAAAFVGDLPPADALYLAFVRSPFAHARIQRIDVTGAVSSPGAVAAFTAADLPMLPIHEIHIIPEVFAQPPLADGVVRFVGEAVVAVVAETSAAAADALEAVVVEYEPLPAVTDPFSATEPGAPVLFAEHGSNVVLEWRSAAPDGALDGADVVVRATVPIPRLAVSPMEGRAVLAAPGPDGRITVWLSTQSPHWSRIQLARSVGMALDELRAIAPQVGGGFGGKAVGGVAEHVVAVAAARRLGRAVRFVEDRTANLSTMQGRGVHLDVELHATRDGVVRALRVDDVCDAGAYPTTGSVEPGKTDLMAYGPYRLDAVDFTARSVTTNLAPTGAYRGPGRSEAAAALEVALDALARELDLDPVDLRRRNLLRADDLPHATPSGAHYDGGDYVALLDGAVARADYPSLRAEQRRRREAGGPLALGIGVSTVIDSTAWFAREETATVRVEPDGSVVVHAGTASAGQDHAQSFVDLVTAVLPVAPADIVVVEGDTDVVVGGAGTSGSRSLQLAGTAVHLAAERVREQACLLTAHLLEAAAEDIVVESDRFVVRGVPARGFTLAELADRAGGAGPWPDGVEPELDARCVFEQSAPTYPAAAHVAVVEVDVETGGVRVVRYVAATDCGRVIDPPSATGQVTGAIVQGIGQALYESFSYDDAGNPLGATLADYLVPSAAELPSLEVGFRETPTDRNPLGARGVGEIGMVAASPAVRAAVVDALAHLGVRRVDLPCTPERVWRAIADAAKLTPAP